MDILSFLRSASFVAVAAAVALISSCGSRSFSVSGNTGEDIQAVIDKASARGGGKVVVPAGEYRVGSIRLRSNIELHLEEGALLLGSDRSEDYFSFPEEICSLRPEKSSKVLLYAYEDRKSVV